MMNLKGRNFLKLFDFTPDEIQSLLDLAAELKAKTLMPTGGVICPISMSTTQTTPHHTPSKPMASILG